MAVETQPTELPIELILDEILPRLPAKSLLRFKSVSHQWNTFISTLQFAKTHILHPSSLSSRSILTVGFCGSIQAIDYNTNLDHHAVNTFPHNFYSFNYLVSSCNGLSFFISACDDENPQFELPNNIHDFDFHYIVYNPILGVNDFVEIQHPFEYYLGNLDEKNNYDEKYYSFGFGYVSSIDDYNIVAVKLPSSLRRPEVVVYVYSFRSKQWKSPRMFTQCRLPLEFQDSWYSVVGILLKETLHWGITMGNDHRCIAAFNLGAQDEFKFMQLPYKEFGEGTRYDAAFILCCMDDCLCAWGRYCNDDVEMWMLKEYGVQESWIKLFRLNPGDFTRQMFGLTSSGKVLIFTSGDDLLLVDFICDPPTYLKLDVSDKWAAVNYVPSLVSPLAIISEQ